jgi:hypothetical protein
VTIGGVVHTIPPQPFTVALGTARDALAVGFSDGLVELAPELPFLSHPAAPALLTLTFALLAIAKAPRVTAPVASVRAMRRADARTDEPRDTDERPEVS